MLIITNPLNNIIEGRVKVLSRVISFSSDNKFSENLDQMIEDSGYSNRSRFLRDAAIFFAEYKQRGDLSEMADDVMLEGHLVIYYQHGHEHTLLTQIRHSKSLDITTHNHSCLKHSHACVDIMLAVGSAAAFREVIHLLNDTSFVDKVSFVSAPMREEGCC